MPGRKPDGILCIIWENWNSIKLFTEKNYERISKIDETRKRYNADVIGGCEPQVDGPWQIMSSSFMNYLDLESLRRKGQHSIVVNTSNNVNKEEQRQ